MKNKVLLCLVALISLTSCAAIKSYLGIAEEAGEKIAQDVLKKEQAVKDTIDVPVEESHTSQ